ncbi:MAG: transposase [Ktedonobacterales bacterium]
MKQEQFTQEQIVGISQQAERGEQPVTELCRSAGIAEVAFYRWRKKYGGMSVSEAARLRELERENARLKRLLAERDLELDATKELQAKSCDAARPAPGRAVSRRSGRLGPTGLRVGGGEPGARRSVRGVVDSARATKRDTGRKDGQSA